MRWLFFQHRIWHVVKFQSQNLTLCSFHYQMWRVVFFSIQKLTCNETLIPNHSFLKSTKNAEYVAFTEKKNKRDFFRKVFWNYELSKFFNCKIWCVVLFQIKIWHELEFLIQTRTRCTNSRSKYDLTKDFQFKIWRVVKILTQNLSRCILHIQKSDAMSVSSVQKLTCGKLLNQNLSFQKKHDSCWMCWLNGQKKLTSFFCANSFEKRHIEIIYFQNMMRCFLFKSKSDTN